MISKDYLRDVHVLIDPNSLDPGTTLHHFCEFLRIDFMDPFKNFIQFSLLLQYVTGHVYPNTQLSIFGLLGTFQVQLHKDPQNILNNIRRGIICS